MITYQDLLDVGDREDSRMEFVLNAIHQHKSTRKYDKGVCAEEYYRHLNRTIMQFQKLLYTVSGKAVPDNWTANYKLASNFYKIFVTQQVQFLLGNGVSWTTGNGDILGSDFDIKVQEAAKEAINYGESFGFFNNDHVEVFSLKEFAPLYDEENGALSAGIRFWQIDPKKPLRTTLYEMDGYTDYIWRDGKGKILRDKRPYRTLRKYTDADGLEIFNGENYPTFPIIPYYANSEHQSEFEGMQEHIDCYDLIKSGFANTVDDASLIYWTIQNAGGMDDIDLAQFVQKMKTIKAAAVQDGQTAEAHTITIPTESSEALLDRLRKDMFRDFMALDADELANATTATEIKARYTQLNAKADMFEYQTIKWIKGLLAVAGVEDDPTFTRSMLINQAEEIQNLVAAGEYLPHDYVTERIMTILGDADRVHDVLKELTEEETLAFSASRADRSQENDVNEGDVNG